MKEIREHGQNDRDLSQIPKPSYPHKIARAKKLFTY